MRSEVTKVYTETSDCRHFFRKRIFVYVVLLNKNIRAHKVSQYEPYFIKTCKSLGMSRNELSIYSSKMIKL